MLIQQQINVLMYVLIFIMHSKIIELVFERVLEMIFIVRILQLHVYQNVNIQMDRMLTIWLGIVWADVQWAAGQIQ